MTPSKRLFVLGALLGAVWAFQSAAAQNITLGFVGDEGSFGDHNKDALKWAKTEFSAKVIKPGDLIKEELNQYAVLWWHDGDTDPTALMTPDVSKVLLAYLDDGGTLLLSAAAEQLATPLGVESGQPRIYGPGNDGQKAGVTIRKDTLDHPVWEGFKRAEGEQIEVTSVGYPKSSDYWSLTFKKAVTIGDCWETGTDWKDQVGAFVEWRHGDGIVFGMGWRLPHWAPDNKSLDTLQKLTLNVIRYLGSESAFLAVRPEGNQVTTWAKLKARP